MGDIIVKPVAEEDFYVVISTVVDAIVECGKREDFIPPPPPTPLIDRLLRYSFETAELERRLERADRTGTSSYLGDYGYDEPYFDLVSSYAEDAPPTATWMKLPRENARDFCLVGNCRVGTGYVSWYHWDDHADEQIEVRPEEET